VSVLPQSFVEVAYSLPPIAATFVGSWWGVVKVLTTARGAKNGHGPTVRELEVRAELERTRWQNVLSAIEGVGTALKEETALVAVVRENQATEIIPKVNGIHEEVVGRREEHAILMRELLGRRGSGRRA